MQAGFARWGDSGDYFYRAVTRPGGARQPVPEDMLAGTGEEAQALAESQRFGVLLLLERLTPVQRAVFVLRELLDCEYDEVAAATGRSAATCRQVFLRARARLGEELPARGLPRA